MKVIIYMAMIGLGLFPSFSFAQYNNNIWVLGPEVGTNNNSILNFHNNSSATTSYPLIQTQLFRSANSAICKDNGSLCFYTNGHEVYDSTFNVMPNGLGLSPSPFGYNDGGIDAIILPKPGHNNLFYVFHETYDTSFTFQGVGDKQPLILYQTTIDMNLNAGKGAVVSKNEHLYQDTLMQGRLAACKHANGRDWWLISHKFCSHEYLKWLITPDSIFGPYIQTIGSRIWIDGYGQACFNTQGTRYANYGPDSVLDIMDFDRCTGLFSNCNSIYIIDSIYYGIGCAFSPNGRFIYTSNYHKIIQYDCDASNVALSGDTVAVWDGTLINGNTTGFFNMQLGLDSQIYISSLYAGVLGVINFPDSLGINCSVMQHSFILPTKCSLSLPKSPNYNLARLQGSPCDTLQWTGVAEMQGISKLLVYPNPASSVVTFEFVSTSNDNLNLKLFDALGNEVKQATVYASLRYFSLNISNLNPGVYYYAGTTNTLNKFMGKVVVIK